MKTSNIITLIPLDHERPAHKTPTLYYHTFGLFLYMKQWQMNEQIEIGHNQHKVLYGIWVKTNAGN